MIFENNISAIASNGDFIDYPKSAPYLPSEEYPEFAGKLKTGKEKNIIYGLLREVFVELGFDENKVEGADWNPLSEIIKPGDNVLIKPNLVRHVHLTGGDYRTVVTNASLIRCVLDYAAMALKGKGQLTVGDAPVQSTDFDSLVERNGLKEVCSDVSQTWGVPVRLADFRLWSVKLDKDHTVVGEQKLSGDAQGYCAVNLGEDSFLQPIVNGNDRFRITSYDTGELQKHHNLERNEYLIPKTVLNADVVINLPKLKTHRKVALTASLKNLVGINGHKDWLPHHRIGSTDEGGDEYRSSFNLKQLSTKIVESLDKHRGSILTRPKKFFLRVLMRVIKHTAPDPYREGSWYGNDTLWRTVLDLNRLLIFADKDGVMKEQQQRRCLTIVDGVIAGEREGPMEPDTREVGVLVGGYNPAVVDAVLATMIGFDYKKIPIIEKAFQKCRWPLATFEAEEISVKARSEVWKNLRVGAPCDELCFVPSTGWLNYVESSACHGNVKNIVKEKPSEDEREVWL